MMKQSKAGRAREKRSLEESFIWFRRYRFQVREIGDDEGAKSKRGIASKDAHD